MHMKYFGDSYDIVKQTLLSHLTDDTNWVVHPMFTLKVDLNAVRSYEELLRCSVICTEVLDRETDRP